jgi:hypothetical protein
VVKGAAATPRAPQVQRRELSDEIERAFREDVFHGEGLRQDALLDAVLDDGLDLAAVRRDRRRAGDRR